MRPLIAAYCALFSVIHDVLRTLSPSDPSEKSVADRAVIVFTLFQWAGIGIVRQWWFMLGWGGVSVPAGANLGIYVILLGLNYLVLIQRGQWKEYVQLLRALPRQQQMLIRWMARSIVVLVTLGAAYTFHRYTFSSGPGLRGG